MGVPTQRFQVNDPSLWGRLVKSWATHLDYVSQDYGDQPPRSNWVNTTWGITTPPEPQTITDVDAQGMPKNWCLPAMTAVSIPRADHTTVTLPGAVALTVAEFTAAVTSGNVKIVTMPAQYKNVIIVQGGPDTIVFRLPPKDTLQGSEDDLLNGLPYNIPPFYNNLYAGQMPTTMPQCPTPQDPGRAGVMELHANRIGEYTLNTCS
jgi:hypothetical protein